MRLPDDYFKGGANLTRGQAIGEPSLQDLIGFVMTQSDRALYVNKEFNSSGFTPDQIDGSLSNPFQKIQDAVTYAESNLSPVGSNPVTIHIAPGFLL